MRDDARLSQDSADPGQRTLHKSDTVTEFVKANKDRLRLVFLPAYTPQFKPIEQQRNVLKRMLVGRYFTLVKGLRAAIVAIARRRWMRTVGMMDYLVAAP